MKETEKAYFAGIIMLQKIHKNEFPSPCVSIKSTTLALLDYIKSTFYKKGMIIKKKNYNLENHKDCYSYVLRRNDAIDFITEIYPYLIINTKRKRAFLIIEKYKALTPRNGLYTNEMIQLKNDFYNEFMSY